jgi:hypothetical protein
VASTSTTNVIEALRYTESEEQLMMALNEESVAWDLLGDSGNRFVRIGGRGMNIQSIVTQLPERISGITEGGTLPSAIAMDSAEATFSAQPVVGVWETSWSLVLRARRSKHAFKNAIALHQDSIETALTQEMSVELLGDGNGSLATLAAADDNTTQNNIDGHPAVRKGMVLDCMDTDLDTKHANSVSVSAVDEATPSFVVSGAPSGSAASDFWCREDTTDDSVNDALHITGLLGIVSNADPPALVGDYGGIDRGTAGNEFWESPVLGNSGTNRTMTSDLLLQMKHVRRKKGGGNTSRDNKRLAFLMTDALERRYAELFDAIRIADVGSGPFSGDVGPKDTVSAKGETAFTFSGIPIHTDVFAKANTVFLLDLPTFSIGYVESKTPRPIDEIFDGQVPFFRQTSSATFEKVSYWEGVLLCTKPSASVRGDDMSES